MKREKLLDMKFRRGLLPAINIVNLSALYFPTAPDYNKSVIDSKNKNDQVNKISRVDYLTTKDINIMQYVANGFTALQIAGKLALSNRTVEHRILDLRKKLSCKSITHLAVTLLRANVIK